MQTSRPNYGDSSFDVRQRFASSVNYLLPFGQNSTFLSNVGPVANHLIGGWGLASIFDIQTGVPFIPTTGTDANRDGDTTDRVVVTGPVPNTKGSLTKNFSGPTPVVHYFAACGAGCPFGTGDGRRRSFGAYAPRLPAQPPVFLTGICSSTNKPASRKS